jgi:hypothetical protein
MTILRGGLFFVSILLLSCCCHSSPVQREEIDLNVEPDPPSDEESRFAPVVSFQASSMAHHKLPPQSQSLITQHQEGTSISASSSAKGKRKGPKRTNLKNAREVTVPTLINRIDEFVKQHVPMDTNSASSSSGPGTKIKLSYEAREDMVKLRKLLSDTIHDYGKAPMFDELRSKLIEARKRLPRAMTRAPPDPQMMKERRAEKYQEAKLRAIHGIDAVPMRKHGRIPLNDNSGPNVKRQRERRRANFQKTRKATLAQKGKGVAGI